MNTGASGGLAGTGRVLLVDDEDTSRRFVKNVLEAAGHRVTEAEDGESGLRAVHESPPDVILLDVMMPGINGFEVCRQLKGDLKTAAIPVLMITSLAERADRLSGIEAGANDFLIKPIDKEEILLRVRNAIHTKRLFDQVQEDYRQLHKLHDLRENLTHMIVHDMREPLAMVRLELEIQKRVTGEPDGAPGRRQLDAACSQVSALVEMANSLLDVSRLETGHLPFNRTLMDILHLAQESVDSLQAMAGRRRVFVEAHHGPAFASCHEYLIRRVITNLIVNAIRSTSEEGEIKVDITGGHERVKVAFMDDGPGIPAEAQAGVFEKFSRTGSVPGGPPATPVGGVSLAFCRLVVESHGGRVGVESEVGQGSTLWFELPREGSLSERQQG